MGTTIKLEAKKVIKSDKALQVNREKNYQTWVQAYMFCLTFENQKSAIKELKAELIELGANKKTVDARVGAFNSAIKNGISLVNLHSFQQVELGNKKIVAGEAKTVKGVIVDKPEVTAEKQQNAEIIKASNESELASILANAEFKKFKAEFLKQGWNFDNLKKALSQK